MGKWLAAVNYYPTTRLRFSVGTGQTTLHRNGLTGKTFQTLARVQWIYEQHRPPRPRDAGPVGATSA